MSTTTPRAARWIGPIVAAALLLTALLAVLLTTAPEPRPTAGARAFSLDRAWTDVEAIARAPHPVGTPEHDRVRSYLLTELEALGLEVDTQTVRVSRRAGRSVRTALVRNLVARLPGTASTGALLLVTHYDAVPLAPGAGDDGIGTATVLETARVLSAGEPLRNDVMFLITDAEEYGLLGARGFAESHPWADEVAAVLNFEARGTSGPAIMFETGPGSGALVREYARVGRRQITGSLFPAVYERLPNDTDFTIFRRRGLPGLNFAIGESAHWYHTPGDRPENLSRASLQHMGDNAVAVARRAASLDLADVARADPVFFTVPGLGIIRYPTALAVPLALLLVAAYVGVAVYAGRRRRLGWWGIPIGFLAGLVSIVAAAAASIGVWLLVRDAHPEYGSVVGRALHREWPYLLTYAALGAALVHAAYGLLRRWFHTVGLALGALLIPTALAVLSAFALVGGSYVFLWPTLLALAALALLLRPEPARPTDAARPAVLAPVTLVILLMAPVIHLVGVFLGAAAAPVFGGLVALVLLMTLPVLDALGRPNRLWFPATALLLGLALTGYGVATAAPTADRPAPGNLVHVTDLDLDRAVWASPVAHANAFTDRFVGQAADTIRLGLYSDYLGGRYRAAKAPAWNVAPTPVRVLSEEVRDGRRVVRVAIAPTDRPMAVEVRLDANPAATLLSPRGSDADGRPAAAGLEGRWTLLGLGTDRPLELELSTSPGDSLRLVLTRHYRGFPPVPDGPSLARPADVMAMPAAGWRRTLSDARVVRETVRF